MYIWLFAVCYGFKKHVSPLRSCPHNDKCSCFPIIYPGPIWSPQWTLYTYRHSTDYSNALKLGWSLKRFMPLLLKGQSKGSQTFLIRHIKMLMTIRHGPLLPFLEFTENATDGNDMTISLGLTFGEASMPPLFFLCPLWAFLAHHTCFPVHVMLSWWWIRADRVIFIRPWRLVLHRSQDHRDMLC